MDTKLLMMLACPICKAELAFKKEQKELWCKNDGLAFPIKDDIPVMLEHEARILTTDERLN